MCEDELPSLKSGGCAVPLKPSWTSKYLLEVSFKCRVSWRNGEHAEHIPLLSVFFKIGVNTRTFLPSSHTQTVWILMSGSTAMALLLVSTKSKDTTDFVLC